MAIPHERPSTQDHAPPPRPTNRLRLGFLIAVLIALLAGCDGDDGPGSSERIDGSGTVITETRSVSGFDGVTLMSAGRLMLTQGTEESLTIEADDNLMAYLKTQVSGGSLKISAEKDGASYNLDPSQEIVFRIGVIELSDLSVFGGGDIVMEALETDRLDLEVMGAADVEIGNLTANELSIEIPGAANLDLAGTVPVQDVNWLGAGDYDGGDLRSETVDISVLGAASIEVWVTDALDISLTGAGTVNYYGMPAVEQSVTGVGTVRSLGPK